MPNTPRLRWPYPAENQDPWYEPFQSLVEAMDATAFAATEDRNIFLMSTATFTWNAGTSTLSWNAAVELSSPVSGFRHTIAAGSQVIADGAMFYVELTRNPTANLTVAGTTASSHPPSVDYESFYAICLRRGTRLYFRNGGFLDDGDARSIFSGGGGGGNVLIWPVGVTWSEVYAEILASTGPVLVLVEHDPGGSRAMTDEGSPAELWNVRFEALHPTTLARTVAIDVEDGFQLAADPDSTYAVLSSKDIDWVFQTLSGAISTGANVSLYIDGGELSHNQGDYLFETDLLVAEFRNNANIIGTGATNLIYITNGGTGYIKAFSGAQINNSAFDASAPSNLNIELDASVEVNGAAFGGNITPVYTRRDNSLWVYYENAAVVSLGFVDNVHDALDHVSIWYRSAINIDDVVSTAARATLGNGSRYWPLVEGAADTLTFQVRIGQAGPYALRISYYMATSHAGNVSLRLDKRAFGDGDNPTSALNTGAGFTVTPGSNTNLHMVTEVDSTSLLTGYLSEGALVTFLLTRVNDGSDTHTGDMRVLGITLVPHDTVPT